MITISTTSQNWGGGAGWGTPIGFYPRAFSSHKKIGSLFRVCFEQYE